jgi:pyrroloquinoline quinone biosynthesis protein E
MVPVGTITMEVTHRCHRRCAFCYVPSLGGPDAPRPEELDARDLARAAGTIASATGCRHVQLSGGEPLLRRDLLRIVQGILDAGARVSILTDGAHLDEPLARSLAALGVKTVQPTLLSADAGVHDRLRGAGAFRAVTRAIATAAQAGLEVSVCMVVTRENFAEAERVAEVAFALGARGLALSRLCPAAGAASTLETLMPDAAQVRAAAHAASAACKSLGLPLAAAVTIPRCVWENRDHPPLRVGVCSLVGPKTTVTIGPDGAIRSCSLSTRVLGHALRDPWDVLARRLWDIELAPLRARPPKPCESCTDLPRCLGGCRLSARGTKDGSGPLDVLAPGPG